MRKKRKNERKPFHERLYYNKTDQLQKQIQQMLEYKDEEDEAVEQPKSKKFVRKIEK